MQVSSLTRLPATTLGATETVAALGFVPSGKAGTRETLKLMGRLVKVGKRLLPVRQTALSLVNGFDQKAWADEAKAIHAFVRDQIRYVRDIRGVETLQTPDKTLEFGQGDCDDKSVLVASLLEAVGHPTRFVAIANQPGSYYHVFVETKIGNKWVGVETTEPVPLGWQPQAAYRLIYFN